jgi:hypothetical protein
MYITVVVCLFTNWCPTVICGIESLEAQPLGGAMFGGHGHAFVVEVVALLLLPLVDGGVGDCVLFSTFLLCNSRS